MAGRLLGGLVVVLWSAFSALAAPAADSAALCRDFGVGRGFEMTSGRPPVSGEPNCGFHSGAADAPISILEFSDFRCPYCAKVSTLSRRVVALYPGQVRAGFRHYPPFPDRLFELAHKATLAAAEQGAFWGMHDLLFAGRPSAGRGDLIEYARRLGLDTERFAAALDSDRLRGIIEQDRWEGKRLGANGTPTFFINGRKLVGAQPLSAFRAVIESELRRVRARSAEVMIDRSGGLAVEGPADPPVVLTVFADFQSPLSARLARTARAVGAAYRQDVRLQFKHFPLRFHKSAKPAHRAAVAAGEQGRFWEMHDILFANQDRLAPGDLEGYAKRLGLDLDRFRSSMRADRVSQVVEQDVTDGASGDVRGVPTLFINGRRIDGVPSERALRQRIDQQLRNGGRELAAR